MNDKFTIYYPLDVWSIHPDSHHRRPHYGHPLDRCQYHHLHCRRRCRLQYPMTRRASPLD